MDNDRHPECRRNRIDRDVIVGRPDPAGREKIVVRSTELIHRFRNPREVVRDYAHLAEADALIV